MPDKAQRNDGVSNVVSRKTREVKLSAAMESSWRAITEFTCPTKKTSNYRSLKDAPDLVCLSHLRWNFVSSDLNIF